MMMVDYNQVKEDLNRYAVEVAELKEKLVAVKGRENAKFYEVLRQIRNTEWGGQDESMNRDKRLNIAGKAMGEIENKYEEYLP